MERNVIKVHHTVIKIPNYELGDMDKIEKMLSIWNESYFRFDNIGFHYDEEKKELLLPRGLDLPYIQSLFNMPLQTEYDPDPYESVSYRLKMEPRNDIQRKSISYLLGEGDFAYTKKYSQLTLNLDTGDGKTYCVIAALTFMKTRAIIITHSDSIKNQWYTSMLAMTDLNGQHIFNIEGSAAIKKLMKMDKIPYKMFLVNHRTIHSYAKKNGWDAVHKLFQKLKIGIKVFDEAHLEFENLMKTDFHTNTKKTIYLTANFERSGHKENRVFSLCFKNIAKYGIETKKEKRKHIIYVPVMFNSRPPMDVRAGMKGRHGLDRNKYSDYLLDTSIFFDVLCWLVEYFRSKEGRMLVLTPKINATEAVHRYLTDVIEGKSIGLYNSTVDDKIKKEALEMDIISSTAKSMGTGTDVKNLRFVIMVEPYTSTITANQTAGRLREYGPDEYTFYLELIDTGFPEVVRMYKKRLPVFKKKCHKILELKYEG